MRPCSAAEQKVMLGAATMAMARRAAPMSSHSQPSLISARRPASRYVTGFQVATVSSDPTGSQSVHIREKAEQRVLGSVEALRPPTAFHERIPVAYQAEYIWLDGVQPTPMLRSKTKIVPDDQQPGIWGFDGSSTEQAPGDQSDCVLRPVATFHDPLRGTPHVLVVAEVLTVDMKPHPTNTRAACERVAKKYAKQDPWFGIEQEYTMLNADGRPHGFPKEGYPGPQGPYYCGVGTGRIYGREIVEIHTQACLDAGIAISGTNPEVMPGQWEFQIGPLGPPAIGDHMYAARWLLQRIAEDFNVIISFDAKPEKGDWNGAGAHTNFSTNKMREDYTAIEKACKALEAKWELHIKNYGAGIEERLTGLHETAPWNKFFYGVSNRGASVRIPWQVAKEGRGYIEDRRPNANADPYTVARLITDTVCSAL
jgi:glutamine synthetase